MLVLIIVRNHLFVRRYGPDWNCATCDVLGIYKPIGLQLSGSQSTFALRGNNALFSWQNQGDVCYAQLNSSINALLVTFINGSREENELYSKGKTNSLCLTHRSHLMSPPFFLRVHVCTWRYTLTVCAHGTFITLTFIITIKWHKGRERVERTEMQTQQESADT